MTTKPATTSDLYRALKTASPKRATVIRKQLADLRNADLRAIGMMNQADTFESRVTTLRLSIATMSKGRC